MSTFRGAERCAQEIHKVIRGPAIADDVNGRRIDVVVLIVGGFSSSASTSTCRSASVMDPSSSLVALFTRRSHLAPDCPSH